MKREFCIIQKSTKFSRAIGVDIEEAESMLEFLKKNKNYQKKLEYIIHRILDFPNMYYADYKNIWQLENKRITEIRLFPNGKNSRIYCSEFSARDGNLYIIMAVFLEKKKDMSISKKINSLIEKIKNYEYELEN